MCSYFFLSHSLFTPYVALLSTVLGVCFGASYSVFVQKNLCQSEVGQASGEESGLLTHSDFGPCPPCFLSIFLVPDSCNFRTFWKSCDLSWFSTDWYLLLEVSAVLVSDHCRLLPSAFHFLHICCSCLCDSSVFFGLRSYNLKNIFNHILVEQRQHTCLICYVYQRYLPPTTRPPVPHCP